jgi:hypothetical protein
MRLVLPACQLLAEATVNMGDSHCATIEAHVEALVWHALVTITAVPARHRGVDSNPVANGDLRHVRPDIHDRASNLVSQDHRMLDPYSAKTAMVVIVQVRAADSSCGDSDSNLPRTGRLRGPIIKPDVVGCVNDDRFHSNAPNCS